MAQMEQPERLQPGHQVTVDDVRQLMGASTPHFALQLRERLRRLIRNLPPGDPARAPQGSGAPMPEAPAGIPGSELTGPWPVGHYAAALRDRLRGFTRMQVF